MKYNVANKRLKGLPFISEDNAKFLFDFILEHKPKRILELGIGHGTSSAYLAAALDELNNGELTCVDLLEVKDHYEPSAESLLEEMGLMKRVKIHRMHSGYNWFLHDKIQELSENDSGVCHPYYDLIIIDGPKNWIIDSSSFFLSDKLLNELGWILWDDYNWAYKDSSEEVTDGISKRGLSPEEQAIPHIKEIFNLLVMQHENYGNFIVQEDTGWAWAQKIKSNTKSIKYTSTRTLQSLSMGLIKKILK